MAQTTRGNSQAEAVRAGYADRIFKALQAALAAGGATELDAKQAPIIRRALRSQYDAFTLAVRQEAGALFAQESDKLQREIERGSGGSK